MSIQVALHHLTHYRYDRPIQLDPQTIRLRPAPHARTLLPAYSLKISPEKHFLNWQQDPFGNFLARAVFPEKVKKFSVEVDLIAEIRVFNPFDFFLEGVAKEFPLQYDPLLSEELKPYLEIKEAGKRLTERLKRIDLKKQGTIDFLVAINQALNQELKYIVRLEPGVQTCEETLQLKSGSCRDMAWLLCQTLRHLGLATRFASGYLIQLKADQKALDGPSGTEQDFTDLHAWTEVYLPGAGWVGLDPTSGLLAGEGHIPLCCTPHPTSAAPISGTLENCSTTLEHTMSVTRIQEDRRVTKPYTETEWEDIQKLAIKVDQNLKTQDVRLTVGGEPTFVSIDDREGEEWQLEALGPTKKARAYDLLWRLKKYFAPKGFLLDGSGKWYPGELLPRWSLNCYWRQDHEVVWEDEQLFAENKKENLANTQSAKNFIYELAKTLGIDTQAILPAREDASYYLWKDQKLPMEGDILKADLFEKTERRRLQKLFNQGLNDPVGFVMPLQYSLRHKGWISNLWRFRNDTLLLLVGDASIGLRLPLNSLPLVSEKDLEKCPDRSLLAKVLALPTHKKIVENLVSRVKNKKKTTPPYLKDPCGKVRTALCVEPREGKMYIFLPPISYLEHFLDLVASIEQTAKKLGTPVVLEGYPPPSDLRMKSFKITPDPGVLEVNVQPAKNWEELNQITTTVYEEARLARLTTEKFLLDGRKVGTGGGNHIVVGGATPADSPFLRRPDLLRSLVSFWLNHPSLSYLFSSLFIGPTSQHPRIDEARHDSLYELEIAFNQMQEKDVSLWKVDRLLRNILVDITGNTHRTEFCIDKLFNPDEDSGRMGLVEIRSFEMPPHPQMSLLQILLVRACIAAFWKKPYQQPLMRWGTRLHDQFMLPHYLWADLKDALGELRKSGYDFNDDWFSPLFEFRFPKCGSIQVDESQIEFRVALEPWPVLGEETYQGQVSRGVDSSVERVQVKATGLREDHYVVTCNGQRIPLHKTSDANTRVAGVRYKAWAQSSSLHPTIPIHTPLIFDVMDLRYERSVGGCTYHVTHPGGRNYDTIPINENEAEGRRLSRFQPMGHSPGKKKIPVLKINDDFPHTLDLRRY